MVQIFRVECIPPNTSPSTLPSLFIPSDRPGICIKSLLPHPYTNTLVATITFTSSDNTPRYPKPANPNTTNTITIDDDFEGLTPLHSGANFDIIAVSDPFEHPYYSWSASADHAWLRDDLPSDIEDARVLLYGHDVELQSEKGMLEACAEKFLHALQQARAGSGSGKGEGKPMVLLGLRTGCLVIEKAMVLAQREAGFKGLERLAGVLFFDAPHAGFPAQFLDMLPEGRSKGVIVSELEEGSDILRQLDVEFARVLGTCTTPVVSCLPEEHVADFGGSRNWAPSSVIIKNKGDGAKLRRTAGGLYGRVIEEIKQCLGLYPPPPSPPHSPPPTTMTTRQHTMKPAENFINFSMPGRSPKSRDLNLNRKDSLSPLASPSPSITKDDPFTSHRMSSPPSPLQRISDAASKSTSSSSSGHTSSASSISSISIQSLVLNKYTISPYMYPDSPAQTPSSQTSQSQSSSGFPFPSPSHSRPVLQFSTPPPTPLMISSSSSIDRDGAYVYHDPSSPKQAALRPQSSWSRPNTTRHRNATSPPSSLFAKIKRAAAPPKSDSVRTTIMEELGGYAISLDYKLIILHDHVV